MSTVRSEPDVSIVIPTYDRLSRLRMVLSALARQTVSADAFEVIVVSDGSSDGTNEYLMSDDVPLSVRVVLQANQGPAVARNVGVEAARGRFVLFIDDDVIPTPALVERHIAVHRCSGDDIIVFGPMLSPPNYHMSPWVAYEQAMLDEQYAAMREGAWEPTARQFYTGNASLGRRHVVEVGGFDPAFERAEDVELAYRLAAQGLRFVFDPDAIGYHYAERSYASWRRTAYLYGRNDVVFVRERGQRWLLPVIQRELRARHPLLKYSIRATLDHPILQALLVRACELAVRAKAERLRRSALSALFNITYYRGVTDAYGSSHWMSSDRSERVMSVG